MRCLERFRSAISAMFRALLERRFDQCFKRYIDAISGAALALSRVPFGAIRVASVLVSGAVSGLLRAPFWRCCGRSRSPSWRYLARRLGAGQYAVLALVQTPFWRYFGDRLGAARG